MAAAAQLLLLCCLLQGSLSQNWGTFMPQSLEGLTGSCVMIPCTFSVTTQYEDDLDDSCVAKWITGSKKGPTVFNSGQSANKNTLQGNLTGNLREKNCTTIFHNMSPKDSDKYFFRLECTGPFRFILDTNVQITIKDSLPEPLITATPAEVEEGAAVRLECSAAAPCPLLPPALTWTPAIGDVKENQQTAAVTSVMSFSASRLHNGQKLQCSALYRRQAGNTDLQYGNDLTLRVLYPPNNTSVSHSGPVIEGTSVNLTCNTDANPAVDEVTWYKVDGEQVAAVGFHAWLSTKVSEADSSFFCQVANKYGSQNSSITQIDVQFPPKGTTVIVQPDGPILEGVSVSLLCQSRANPPIANYTWYKGDEEEEEESGSSLNLSAVDRSNSGHYLCKARNELGEGQSAATQLDIQYPPNNTSVSHSGPVIEGTSVNLSCNTDANPPVDEVTWYKVDGEQVAAVGFHAWLSTKVSEADSSFFCQVANRYGSQNSSITQIDVQFPPKGTTVIVQPDGPILEGVSVSLLCQSRANPPITNYTWYKGDEEEEEESGPSLNINAVDRSNSGHYLCKARNELGEGQSAATQLDIQYPPNNTSVSHSGPVIEGTSVNLTCNTDANPAVDEVTWYKVDGDQVAAVGFHAWLSTKVSEADSSFFCQVANRYGSQNSSITQIDVQFPPKGTTVIVQPDGPILEGVSVSLLCQSRANPPITNYTWYKGDEEEEEESGSKLNLSAVDRSNSGHYLCKARNELGEGQSAATQLDIQFPPQILPSSSCMRNSSLIRCDCISQGNPPPSLFWELAGEAVNHSVVPTSEVSFGSLVMRSQITLNYVDADGPSLVCLSNNSVGSDRFVFKVYSCKTKQDSSGLNPISLLIGSLVGAMGTLLVCGLMLLIFFRKGIIRLSTKGSRDTSNAVVADGTSSSELNVIYDNKAILEGYEEESVHYASVDFVKRKAGSKVEVGNEEIRGLASKTSEYAEVRLPSRGSNGGHTMEEETEADAHHGEGMLS